MSAIAEGLYTESEPVRLIGGRHMTNGRVVFPCPSGGDWEPYPLKRQGRLWSYTVQRFRPKSPPYEGPEAFAPWAVGYIELADETIVEARLANVELDEIRIGMPLRLTFVDLDPMAVPSVQIHAFEPLPSTEESQL